MTAPWRRDFDAARDPYTARNALGIPEPTGGGGSPAPSGAEYITGSSDPTLTNERVLTDTASITWDLSTPGQAKANATAGAGPFVAKAGDTMTGNLTIDKSTPALALKKAAGTDALLDSYVGTAKRWRITLGSSATESGGNTGSDFAITRFDDAGTAIAYILSSDRATGSLSVAGPVNSSGDVTIDKSTPLFTLRRSSASTPAIIDSFTGSARRWRITMATNAAETGSNAGSDFAITNYNDAGSALASPMTISRASGIVNFSSGALVPTVTAGDNSVNAASTAFVQGEIAAKAPLASPTFTGDPKAPTPAFGDSDTSIATTAFVATGFALTNIRKFTANGTYPTATNAAVKVLVICKGAGGSGGGCNVAGGVGAGGGEGAEVWKLTTAGALSGQTVTVGTGGAAIAANTNTAGNNGTSSSIGSVVSASGGGGGQTPSGNGVPGLGGSTGTGDWIKPGINGGQGTVGAGTTTLFSPSGGGHGGGYGTVAGAANSGGGGGGSFSTANGSGAGASGIVICLEFGTI